MSSTSYAVNVREYGLDFTGATDNASKLTDIYNDLLTRYTNGKPMPKLVFPEGVLSFSSFPNLAFPYLQILADGECHLKYTGSSIAINLDGTARSSGTGIRNMVMDGNFILENAGTSGLVLSGIHNSYFKMNAQGASTGNFAIVLKWCVCTELRPTISTNDPWPTGLNATGIGGVMLTNTTGVYRTTACVVNNPVIEGLSVGMIIDYADANRVVHGTIEGGTNGVIIGNDASSAPNGNELYGVEFEANSGTDIIIAAGTYNKARNCYPTSPSNSITGSTNGIVWS